MKKLIEILKSEVKPALGCTEPVAVALACAKAKELLNEEIKTHKILVSPNVYKNGMCVGIPGTERIGLKISVALGFIGGNSKNGLEIFESLTKKQIELAEKYMDNNDINISPVKTDESVYIEVMLNGENNSSKVIIKGKHDKFVYLKQNDNILLDDNENEIKNEEDKENILENITIKEIVESVDSMNFDDIKFLLDGIDMNEKIANFGINEKIGVGVGYGIKKSIESGIISDDLINSAMMLTAGAADARMAGIKMPVMSSNGSGNHGITAIIPIVAYNKKIPQTDEKLAKALAISHLVTAYVKRYTGRLSAVCGCGVAASTGATAGISYLMNNDIRKIEGAIENIIGNLSGMICDGAKSGCALKLASSASAAIQSALIANQECFVPSLNGIVSTKVEESIKNLGKINKGMFTTEEVVIDIMEDMNKVN